MSGGLKSGLLSHIGCKFLGQYAWRYPRNDDTSCKDAKHSMGYNILQKHLVLQYVPVTDVL